MSNEHRIQDMHPDAKNVRWEGLCKKCEYPQLWSYQEHFDHDMDTYNLETCGFFCQHCGNDTAGWREKYNIPDF